MNLALFLHLYQPPIQKRDIVLAVAVESYVPIVEGLQKHPHARLTLNIAGCLLSQLAKYGYSRLLVELGDRARKGQIELVGSSGYHAFLPNLPEKQIIRQITLQTRMIEKYLGKNIKLRGFFPPEMAFTPRLSSIAEKQGFKWILLDEYAKRGSHAYAPLYQDRNGMTYFLRNRAASYGVVAESLKTSDDVIELVRKSGHETLYTIIGLDGETFGHHRPGYEKILEKVYEDRRIQLHTISALEKLDLVPSVIVSKKSSWTILDQSRSKKQPFIRWDDPENEIHRLQWTLTRMAYKSKHDEKSQTKLDRALFSCQYWWACARPWWRVEIIESGAHALLQAIIYSHATAKYKRKAVDLYHDIIATAFDWMRSGKMQRWVDKEHEHLHMNAKTVRVNR